MRFAIQAGSHVAMVEIDLDGKGGFSGQIISQDFGNGRIGGVQTGDHLKGSVNLAGHNARFDATLLNGAIKGTLTAGWFFSQDFEGTAA